MNLLARIFAEPELQDDPPVLVDVGAAGGVRPAWRKIARYSVGVAFEPDARDSAPLTSAHAEFRRWVFCPGIAVPSAPPSGRAELHLTRSPQCSSTLRPRTGALGEWAFAELFDVIETRTFPAMTLVDALQAQGLKRVDWLKCDTQGLDLALYLSLPDAWRAQLLAVEFEPGLTDIYEGEDKLADILRAMAGAPFWISELNVGRTPRARPEQLSTRFGAKEVKWVRRLGQGAPAWANVGFLRDPHRTEKPNEPLDRRGFLLGWVFASLSGHHGAALTMAEAGRAAFPGPLFDAMADAAAKSLRRSLWRGWPRVLWRRLRRG